VLHCLHYHQASCSQQHHVSFGAVRQTVRFVPRALLSVWAALCSTTVPSKWAVASPNGRGLSYVFDFSGV
jgi:hypothetical protein